MVFLANIGSLFYIDVEGGEWTSHYSENETNELEWMKINWWSGCRFQSMPKGEIFGSMVLALISTMELVILELMSIGLLSLHMV